MSDERREFAVKRAIEGRIVIEYLLAALLTAIIKWCPSTPYWSSRYGELEEIKRDLDNTITGAN